MPLCVWEDVLEEEEVAWLKLRLDLKFPSFELRFKDVVYRSKAMRERGGGESGQ